MAEGYENKPTTGETGSTMNTFAPSLAVQGVIAELSQEGKPRRRRGRPRKNKTGSTPPKKQSAKGKAAPRNLHEPILNPKSRTWPTHVCNIVLLIAIFSLVYLTHHTLRSPSPSVKEPTLTSQTEVPTAPITPQVEEEKVEVLVEDENPVEAETPIQEVVQEELIEKITEETVEEPTLPIAQKKPQAIYPEKRRAFRSPYNDGGELDLDNPQIREFYLSLNNPQAEEAQEEVPVEEKVASTEEISIEYPTPPPEISRGNDYRNPWNDEGPYDLDGETVREQYQRYSQR